MLLCCDLSKDEHSVFAGTGDGMVGYAYIPHLGFYGTKQISSFLGCSNTTRSTSSSISFLKLPSTQEEVGINVILNLCDKTAMSRWFRLLVVVEVIQLNF